MIDLYGPNNLRVHTDNETFTVYDASGKAILSYHPLQGEVVMGIMLPPSLVEKARHDLRHAQQLVSRSLHPIQQTGEI